MKQLALFLLSAWMLASCTDPKQEQVATEKAAVMAIHDEAMPKMDEIAALKRELKMQLNDTATLDSSRNATIEDAIYCLEKSERIMFDFMAGYKFPQVDMNADSALLYLAGKKEEALAMKDFMFRCIEEANQFHKKQ